MTFIKRKLPEADTYRQLIRCCWFTPFCANALRPMMHNCSGIEFETGDILFRESQKTHFLPLITEGECELYRMTYSGDEKIFGLYKAAELVAVAAVFMQHRRYPLTLRARTAGRAVLIQCADFRALCASSAALSNLLLCHFSQKLYDSINQIDWLTSSTAAERLAAYLIGQQQQQQTAHLLLPLSRAQLAVKLGVRSETLSRLLAGWKRQNMIEYSGRQVTILVNERLSGLAAPSVRNF